MPRAVHSVVLVGILLGGPASARPLDCPELYNDQFSAALDEVDRAFTALEFPRATAMLTASRARIPCLIEIVPSPMLARFAVQQAYAESLAIEVEEATRWAQLAQALDAGFVWPAYVPQTHATRRLLDGLEPLGITAMRGKGLRPDPGGAIFLDGRLLVRPEAEPGIPHLLQVGDGSGEIWLAAWQDGVVFPEDILGPPAAISDELPLWYGKPPGSVVGPRPVRARRLETSLGFAVAAGALLGSAWVAREAYLEHPTDGLRLAVNGTTVASAGAGGAAVGFLGVALFTKR